MAKEIEWEARIGRRLRLRDLHVFFTAVQCGSMAKAGQKLGVTQPAVSRVVADLEQALGVRLLDRGARGVEPTMYGRALLTRGNAAFDELRQSVRDIEFLADPTVTDRLPRDVRGRNPSIRHPSVFSSISSCGPARGATGFACSRILGFARTNHRFRDVLTREAQRR